MTRVYKGRKGGKPKLVCSVAKVGGGCEYQGVSVGDVEDAITRDIGTILAEVPIGDEYLDQELERLQVLRWAISDQIENIVNAISIGGDSAALREQLRALEDERDRRDQEEKALGDKIAAVSRVSIHKRLSEFERLVTIGADKAAINAVLRQLLKGIVVDRPNGRLTFQWEHGGESSLMFAWPTD
jgi:hypothetical protein